jgi:hypothetical protein
VQGFPASRTVKEKATKTALGAGPWHINADQTIWPGSAVHCRCACEYDVDEPANVELVITGRRLDGESASTENSGAKDTTAGYIGTAMTFPKPGAGK